MLTIYGTYRSRATRTYWLAHELGLDFVGVPVIQGRRLADPLAADAPLNTLTPSFLAMNPSGFIPAIDDDGFVMFESMAINLYLARKHGGPLAPASSAEEAQASMWSFFAATSIETDALKVALAVAGGQSDTEAGKAEISDAATRLARPLRVIENHLAANGHMVGGRFTVADINVAEIIRYAQGAPDFSANYPAITGWLKSVQARPAFQKMWEARAAEAP